MSETSSLEQLKKVYSQYTFIHEILTQRTQYYLNEFEVAKDAAKTITDVANKIAEEIQQLMQPASEAVIDVESEVAANE